MGATFSRRGQGLSTKPLANTRSPRYHASHSYRRGYEVSLSTAARELLRRAGWYDSHTWDVSEYAQALADEGYAVKPCVVEFMKRFGGLHVAADPTEGNRARNKLATPIHPAVFMVVLPN